MQGWRRLWRFGRGLLGRYMGHGVGRQSAAIAYYLIFSLFPFLIFISAALGLLRLEVGEVLAVLARLIPAAALTLAEDYLRYVTAHSSPALLSFALVFTIYFPARTAGALRQAVRLAYGRGWHSALWREAAGLLGYTLFLIVLFLLTAVTLLVGKGVVTALAAALGLWPVLPGLWAVGRFALLGAVMLLGLLALYRQGAPPKTPWRALLPGAAAALGAWLPLSLGFAWYVARFGRYVLLYGSIGAVMATLVWLWLSAVVVILGAEANALWQGSGEEG